MSETAAELLARIKPLNVQAMMTTPPPDISPFVEGKELFLQTDDYRSDHCSWYLSTKTDDDPAYFIKVERTMASVLGVLRQFALRPWANPGQLLEAMYPAIQTVLQDLQGL